MTIDYGVKKRIHKLIIIKDRKRKRKRIISRLDLERGDSSKRKT